MYRLNALRLINDRPKFQVWPKMNCFALLAALQDDDALLQELKKSDLTENEASLIESQGFDYELIIEGCLKIQREALTTNELACCNRKRKYAINLSPHCHSKTNC